MGHLQRQGEYLFGPFQQSRHLDRETSLACVQRPGGNQLVVAPDKIDQLFVGDLVAVEYPWVDLDLDHLLAITSDVRFQYLAQPLYLVLQVPRQS